MRTKLTAFGMSMIVVVALVVECLAIPYFNHEYSNPSSATINAGESLKQDANANANTAAPRRRRPNRRRAANANTGASTEATPETTPETTTPPADQATPPGTGMTSSMKGQRKGGRKGGRKMRMSGVPSGVENCLNHLAQMAAADPLIDYEGHPSEIINNGLLWNDPKSKCAVTDQTQREKIFDLANAWRMKDAAKVRSLLSELGATGGTTGSK